MTLKLDNKPRFKTLKKIFYSYYRFSITDFFTKFISLLKYKNKSWQQIKNWSFFLNTKSNNFLYKLKKPRFNYIIQNQSCLVYTKMAGHKKKRYTTDILNSKFNMKLLGFYNMSHVWKNFGNILKKSKGNRNLLFKYLILNIENKDKNFIFRSYFTNTLNQSNAFTKQNYIFFNDNTIHKKRNYVLNTGSVLKLNIDTTPEIDLLKDIVIKKI